MMWLLIALSTCRRFLWMANIGYRPTNSAGKFYLAPVRTGQRPQ